MEASETLDSFFWEKLRAALAERGVTPAAETEHYLVRLLTDYATRPVDEQPLALRLMAAEGAAPPERRRQLREIGDTSLFVSGFWSDSFARRIVDVDYYIGVGGSAYGRLAQVSDGWSRDPFGAVFGELAEGFKRFVQVLETLSHWVRPPQTPQDMVRLYDKYRNSGSSWAKSRLAAMGVFLPDGGGKAQ
jgi:hypothetical protein